MFSNQRCKLRVDLLDSTDLKWKFELAVCWNTLKLPRREEKNPIDYNHITLTLAKK